MLCELEGGGHSDPWRSQGAPGVVADYQKLAAERTGKNGAEGILRLKVERILKR